MLKYISRTAMVIAILIIFTTLGIAGQYYNDSNTLIKPKFNQLTPEIQKEVSCLASNIYFEARNEPMDGQIAVAFVTINRVNSPDFPDTICDVVKQKTKTVCQFSWYCESKPKGQHYNMLLTKNNTSMYNQVLETAIYVYANQDKIKDPTNGSLYFHATYVKPNWKHLDRYAAIGRHIFYKEGNNNDGK